MADKTGKAKAKKAAPAAEKGSKKSPLAPVMGLLAPVLAKLGSKGMIDEAAVDPFDNPALMAAIAGDIVVSLPPLEVPVADEEDEEGASAAASDDGSTDALMTAVPDTMGEVPAAAETAAIPPAATPAVAMKAEGPSFVMASARREGLGVSYDDEEDDLFPIRDEVATVTKGNKVRRIAAIAAGVVLLLGIGGGGFWWWSNRPPSLSQPASDMGGLSTTHGQLVVINSGGGGGALLPPIPVDTTAASSAAGPTAASQSPWLKDTGIVTETVKNPAVAVPPPVADTALPLAPVSEGALPPLADAPMPSPPHPGEAVPAFVRLADVAYTPLPPPPANGEGAAWSVNGRHFDGSPTAPRVALIVAGLGLDRVATQAAINRLPVEVSLSFSPYAPDLAAQIADARAHGHEVLLDLPMEPIDFPVHDAGPLALMSTGNPADNLARLQALLARAGGCAGFLGRDGAKIVQTPDLMAPIADALAKRGFLWVQPAGAPAPGGSAGGPVTAATLDIDQRGFADSTSARLDYLAAVARSRGVAVGVARPLPGTLETMIGWVAGLKAAGVSLAPATATATMAPAAPAAAPAGAPAENKAG